MSKIGRYLLASFIVVAGLTVIVSDLVALQEPADGEVLLSEKNGWQAYLLLDNKKMGIWTVEAFNIVPEIGSLEVVGLDDAGRAHVLTTYSGKWSSRQLINDGRWLGGLAHGDVDPRWDGAEIYAGSQQGNLYQIVVHENVILDYRLIGRIPGHEIHTILANPFEEHSLIVFTNPGGVYLFRPTGADGRFELASHFPHDGRIRQALQLPASDDASPTWATVSRNGRLDLMKWVDDQPRWKTVHETQTGIGRIAISPRSTPDNITLYATLDDGRIIQSVSNDQAAWTTKTIFVGDQGPRGIAVGRFTENTTADQLAICGYNSKVQVLTETDKGVWVAETIFEDADKCHWLSKTELDGRNQTDELLVSGYSGRIVMLTRPPGYGMKSSVVDEQNPVP